MTTSVNTESDHGIVRSNLDIKLKFKRVHLMKYTLEPNLLQTVIFHEKTGVLFTNQYTTSISLPFLYGILVPQEAGRGDVKFAIQKSYIVVSDYRQILLL